MTTAHSLDSLHFSCGRQPAWAWVDGPVSICRWPQSREGSQDEGPQGSQSQGGRSLLMWLLSSGDDGDGSKYDSQASQEERPGGPEMHWRDCTPLISQSQPRGSHSCWMHPSFRPWCRKGVAVPNNALFSYCASSYLYVLETQETGGRNHLAS